MGFLGDMWDSITTAISNALSSVLETILNLTIYRLFYYIEIGILKIVGLLDQMFQVFAGITKVYYDDKPEYLINVFFQNHAVSNIYWGMALIGIVMCVGFAIFAVVRKLFDASGKIQQSYGQTVTNLLKSIFLILGMSAIMVVVLNVTGRLMQQINLIFNDADNLDYPETIVFSDEQFAAMGRALNTIGNYSVNPSYSNRYNINTCFNEIRSDLAYLQNQGIFRYHYETRDSSGKEVNTWQAVLQEIANAAPLDRDLMLDVPNESVTYSLTSAMNIMRNDKSFKPLEKYTRDTYTGTMVPLDRVLFLMGALHAAKNEAYNKSPALDDSLRLPYYMGRKSIYNLKTVNSDFSIAISDMDYLVVYITGIALIFSLVTIMLNCIARIFNMLFLYIIAPPIIAAQPLDNGGKTKQWMTAFLVQSLSVFGTVVSMRLLLIYMPIVASPKLVLFKDNVLLNLMAKLVLIYGGYETVKKSTSLFTGILADSAGWQSVQAGDMSSSAAKGIGTLTGAAKSVAGKGLSLAGSAASFAAKPLTNRIKQPFKNAAERWKKLGTGERQRSEQKQIEREISMGKAKEQYANAHKEDAKYLSGLPPKPPSGPQQTNNPSANNPSSNTTQPGSSDLPQNNNLNSNSNPDGGDAPPPASQAGQGGVPPPAPGNGPVPSNAGQGAVPPGMPGQGFASPGNRQPGQGAMPPGSRQPGQGVVPPGNRQPGQGTVPPGNRQPGQGAVPPGPVQPGQGAVPPGPVQPGQGSGSNQPTGMRAPSMREFMQMGDRRNNPGRAPLGFQPDNAMVNQVGQAFEAQLSGLGSSKAEMNQDMNAVARRMAQQGGGAGAPPAQGTGNGVPNQQGGAGTNSRQGMNQNPRQGMNQNSRQGMNQNPRQGNQQDPPRANQQPVAGSSALPQMANRPTQMKADNPPRGDGFSGQQGGGQRNMGRNAQDAPAPGVDNQNGIAPPPAPPDPAGDGVGGQADLPARQEVPQEQAGTHAPEGQEGVQPPDLNMARQGQAENAPPSREQGLNQNHGPEAQNPRQEQANGEDLPRLSRFFDDSAADASRRTDSFQQAEPPQIPPQNPVNRMPSGSARSQTQNQNQAQPQQFRQTAGTMGTQTAAAPPVQPPVQPGTIPNASPQPTRSASSAQSAQTAQSTGPRSSQAAQRPRNMPTGGEFNQRPFQNTVQRNTAQGAAVPPNLNRPV